MEEEGYTFKSCGHGRPPWKDEASIRPKGLMGQAMGILGKMSLGRRHSKGTGAEMGMCQVDSGGVRRLVWMQSEGGECGIGVGEMLSR